MSASHEPTSHTFEANAREALANARLQKALGAASGRFVSHRASAVAERPDFEELRRCGHAIKQEALDRLPQLLEQFEEHVVARGGRVHWARDAEEANQHVIRIAKNENVKRIVKSKSMATEEIHLNHALEAAGFEVVETDLGEFIIQLDKDIPSHIIAPAVHLTKEQVSEIFERELRETNAPGAGIPGLNAIARRTLRKSFLSAEMGISGANFAAADSGSIVIVENEGNAGLCSTLPRIHVAVVGIEKLVPRFDDLAVMLKLLGRSATGQRLTSYTNFITGIAGDGEEGPEQFHVILLDNGRSKIYDDDHLWGSLRCIRCGACLNACPVYKRAGGHAYGWVYQGPIGAVITPQYLGLERAPALPYASSLCGACFEVCPVKIEIPHMLLELRSQVVEASTEASGAAPKRPFFESLSFGAFAFLGRRPKLWDFATRLGRWLLRARSSDGQIPALSLPLLNRWTARRDLRAPARETFREEWARRRGRADAEADA
ncbi:MAG: LutB/LldF family L-lactate oxidation iron-sulfur protein [Planctomycetota bacterium]|nr:LutB/LldF family L-lactate oxidation iron-sulfur protein [Planctomycetota bacterium]